MFKQPSLYNIDHIAEALMFKQPSLYNIALRKPFVQATISV